MILHAWWKGINWCQILSNLDRHEFQFQFLSWTCVTLIVWCSFANKPHYLGSWDLGYLIFQYSYYEEVNYLILTVKLGSYIFYGHIPIRPIPFGPTTISIWVRPIWALHLGPFQLGPAFRHIPIGPILFGPILFGPMVVSDFTLSIYCT